MVALRRRRKPPVQLAEELPEKDASARKSDNRENPKGRKPEKSGEGCLFARPLLLSFLRLSVFSGFRDFFPWGTGHPEVV